MELKGCSVENLETNQTDGKQQEFKLPIPQVMMQGNRKAFGSSIFAGASEAKAVFVHQQQNHL
jgi:hypothetical protein